MKESIGQRIKAIRENQKLSTISFSKLLGISQPSLTALENNKSEPRSKTIIALYEKLGVDPLWLLLGKTNHVIQNPTSLKIGQIVDNLPETVRLEILALAQKEELLRRLLKEKKDNENLPTMPSQAE